MKCQSCGCELDEDYEGDLCDECSDDYCSGDYGDDESEPCYPEV